MKTVIRYRATAMGIALDALLMVGLVLNFFGACIALEIDKPWMGAATWALADLLCLMCTLNQHMKIERVTE